MVFFFQSFLWLIVNTSKQKLCSKSAGHHRTVSCRKAFTGGCLRFNVPCSREHVDILILPLALRWTGTSVLNPLFQAASYNLQILPHITCFTISKNVNRLWFVRPPWYHSRTADLVLSLAWRELRSRKQSPPHPGALTLEAELTGAGVSDAWPSDAGPPCSGSAIVKASPLERSHLWKPVKILQTVCRQVSPNVWPSML